MMKVTQYLLHKSSLKLQYYNCSVVTAVDWNLYQTSLQAVLDSHIF